MATMVNLALLYAAMFGGLALLCLCLYAALRNQRSILWLGASLLLGAIETGCIALFAGSDIELVAVGFLLPACYLSFARALHLSLGTAPQAQGLSRLAVALAAVSLVMIPLDAPYTLQAIPLEFACALPLLEATGALWRLRRRGPADTALMACLGAIAATFVARAMLLPLLYPARTPYAVIKASQLDAILVPLAGLLVLPSVFLLLWRIISAMLRSYRTRADRDYLTGLFNREAFDLRAEAFRGATGCVLFCDIDHFKRINDCYGHASGDEVIRAFARLLSASGHLAGRIGGEEFAVLLPGRELLQAWNIAEGLRAAFATMHHPQLAANDSVSASFGIAAYTAGQPLRTVFIEADAALYRAKDEGRNRVQIAPGKPAPDRRFAPRIVGGSG